MTPDHSKVGKYAAYLRTTAKEYPESEPAAFWADYLARGEELDQARRDLAEAREQICRQERILREQGAELREAENDAYIGWCIGQDDRRAG